MKAIYCSMKLRDKSERAVNAAHDNAPVQPTASRSNNETPVPEGAQGALKSSFVRH